MDEEHRKKEYNFAYEILVSAVNELGQYIILLINVYIWIFLFIDLSIFPE